MRAARNNPNVQVVGKYTFFPRAGWVLFKGDKFIFPWRQSARNKSTQAAYFL